MNSSNNSCKWGIFCGNCCNGKTEDQQKVMMHEATSGDIDLAMVKKWCMLCGNCCNDKKKTDDQILSDMKMLNDGHKDADSSLVSKFCRFRGSSCHQAHQSMTDWCMFCGNCCNGQSVFQVKAVMTAATSGTITAMTAEMWCMFCGNCCNVEKTMEKKTDEKIKSEMNLLVEAASSEKIEASMSASFCSSRSSST